MTASPFPSLLKKLPQDPIYGVVEAFRLCERKDKINLAIGVVPEAGTLNSVFCFPSVVDAFHEIAHIRPNFSYNALAGIPSLRSSVGSLFQLPNNGEWNHAIVQSVGGSGALATLGRLFFQHGVHSILYGIPSWPNHRAIFSSIGMDCTEWNWCKENSHGGGSTGIDIDAFFSACAQHAAHPNRAAALFHLSCHNPTGIDPSHDEWDEILRGIRTKLQGMQLLFDCAYLGFQSPAFEEELYPIRRCLELKIPFGIAFSCAKSLGLYSERVGHAIYVGSASHTDAIQSHLVTIQRKMYSSTPKLGALIADLILDPKKPFFQRWKQELSMLSSSMHEIRASLAKKMSLAGLETSMIEQGNGLFFLSSLSQSHIDSLARSHAIFLTQDGRVNIAALSSTELQERFVQAIVEVQEHSPRNGALR